MIVCFWFESIKAVYLSTNTLDRHTFSLSKRQKIWKENCVRAFKAITLAFEWLWRLLSGFLPYLMPDCTACKGKKAHSKNNGISRKFPLGKMEIILIFPSLITIFITTFPIQIYAFCFPQFSLQREVDSWFLNEKHNFLLNSFCRRISPGPSPNPGVEVFREKVCKQTAKMMEKLFEIMKTLQCDAMIHPVQVFQVKKFSNFLKL